MEAIEAAVTMATCERLEKGLCTGTVAEEFWVQ